MSAPHDQLRMSSQFREKPAQSSYLSQSRNRTCVDVHPHGQREGRSQGAVSFGSSPASSIYIEELAVCCDCAICFASILLLTHDRAICSAAIVFLTPCWHSSEAWFGRSSRRGAVTYLREGRGGGGESSSTSARAIVRRAPSLCHLLPQPPTSILLFPSAYPPSSWRSVACTPFAS